MPRTPGIRRYIFNMLTVVSLLMMVATVGLWVDSFWYRPSIGYVTEADHIYNVSIDGAGVIVFSFADLTPIDPRFVPPQGWLVDHDYVGFDPNHEKFSYYGRFDFRWDSLDFLEARFSGLTLPLWFLALIFAVLPTIWLFKWNKRRKLGPNACPSCGYDLTGNETGLCPECGVTIESSDIEATGSS